MTATETVYDVRLATLCRGLAGCHGDYAGSSSSVTMYDSRLSCYYGELVEGGYVIDNRAVLDANAGLSFASPMCKGNLATGETDAFQLTEDGRSFAAMLSDPACFGGLAAMMALKPNCGAFDYVAPDVYAAWWHSKGARVGRRRGDRIEWNDGTAEAIRPCEQRWQCAE